MPDYEEKYCSVCRTKMRVSVGASKQSCNMLGCLAGAANIDRYGDGVMGHVIFQRLKIDGVNMWVSKMLDGYGKKYSLCGHCKHTSTCAIFNLLRGLSKKHNVSVALTRCVEWESNGISPRQTEGI